MIPQLWVSEAGAARRRQSRGQLRREARSCKEPILGSLVMASLGLYRSHRLIANVETLDRRS